MTKKICSIIIIATLTVFAACEQSLKQDVAVKNIRVSKTKPELANASSRMKHTDSLLQNQAKAGANKPSCCIEPPSRFKAKVDKK